MALSPRERRRRFLAAVRRQARRRGAQIDDRVAGVLGTLAELQGEIRDILAAAPSDFEAARLPALLSQLERHTERWRRRAIGDVDEAIAAAFELGPELVTGPLAAAEVSLGVTLVPTSLLDELANFAADRISDLGPLAQTRIEDALRVGLLGGKTPHDVMVDIGSNLKSPGPFKFVAFRAETIYRTEMGRTHSMAGHRRHLEAAAKVPGLKKQWIWSGKARASHAVADGQVREVDEPFDVAGERLMFPRDPDGSAGNTINCGCESVPYKDDW